MKIQSTDTFRSSRRLGKWDSTGQKWQSEHNATPSKVTPAPVELKDQQKLNANETKVDNIQKADKKEAITFKSQVQHDSFQGKTITPKATKTQKAKTIGTLILGLGAVGLGILIRNRPY